jgi:hypothetical protein
MIDGQYVSGAHGSVLRLGNVKTNDAANYTVVVTNITGGMTSAVATLTVVTPSPITLRVPIFTNGVFAAFFTNTPGASFTLLASTNLNQPLSNWVTVGSFTESPLGQFKFVDVDATNNPWRFYRVRSP